MRPLQVPVRSRWPTIALAVVLLPLASGDVGAPDATAAPAGSAGEGSGTHCFASVTPTYPGGPASRVSDSRCYGGTWEDAYAQHRAAAAGE